MTASGHDHERHERNRLPPRARRAFDLGLRRRAATDVDDELEFHVEMRIEHLVARGWTRADAEAEARRRFGPSWDDAVRQLHRSGHQREDRIAMRERLGSLWYDVRHAVRGLRRDARYTLAVVLTLALGIDGYASLMARTTMRPTTSRSGAAYGSGRTSTWSTNDTIVVVAPRPRASVSMTASV